MFDISYPGITLNNDTGQRHQPCLRSRTKKIARASQVLQNGIIKPWRSAGAAFHFEKPIGGKTSPR